MAQLWAILLSFEKATNLRRLAFVENAQFSLKGP